MVRKDTVAIPRQKPPRSEHHHTSSATDEARWQLVLAHAPTADFLYGVVSTGIFCRTSCPSRRPRRANTRFFDCTAVAVAAGFRACRRCRPESRDPGHENPRAAAEKQVGIACEYVRRRKGEAQLLDIAAHVGLSPRYLHGLFKQVVGTTPGAYVAAVKLENSRESSASVSTSAPTSVSVSVATPPIAVPDTLVLGNVPCISEFGDAAASLEIPVMSDSVCASLPNLDENNCLLPDLDWSDCQWFPEVVEAYFSSNNFNQETFPEWINEDGMDILAEFSTADYGVLGPQADMYQADYVDPLPVGS